MGMVFWWSLGVQNSGRAVAWECFGLALWQFQIRKRLSHGKILRRVLKRLKKLHILLSWGCFCSESPGLQNPESIVYADGDRCGGLKREVSVQLVSNFPLFP